MRGRRMAFAGEREGSTRRADSHSVSSSESVELSQLDGKGARRLRLSPLENASHPCSSPGDTAPAVCDARRTSNTLHVSPAESVNVLAAMVAGAHGKMAEHTGWRVGFQHATARKECSGFRGWDGRMVRWSGSDLPTLRSYGVAIWTTSRAPPSPGVVWRREPSRAVDDHSIAQRSPGVVSDCSVASRLRTPSPTS